MANAMKLSDRLCQKLATAHALQKAASDEAGDGVKMTKVNIVDAAHSGVMSDLQKNTFKNENGSLPGDASNAVTTEPDKGNQQGLDVAAVVTDYDPADTDAKEVLGATDNVIKAASALIGRVEAIAGMRDSDVDAAMAKYASADFNAYSMSPEESLQLCENVLVKMANAGFEPAQQLIDFAVSYDQGVRKKASDLQELMAFARTNPQLRKTGAAEDPAVANAILNNAAEQSPLDVMVDPNTGALADGINVEDLPEEQQAALAAASEQTDADLAAAGAEGGEEAVDDEAVVDAIAEAAADAGLDENDVAALVEDQLQGEGVPVEQDPDEATIDAVAEAAAEAGLDENDVAALVEDAVAEAGGDTGASDAATDDAALDAVAESAAEAGMDENDVADMVEKTASAYGIPIPKLAGDDEECDSKECDSDEKKEDAEDEAVADQAVAEAEADSPEAEAELAQAAVQDLGAQIESEAQDLTAEVAAQIQEADPSVTDEEAIEAATDAVTDAITAAVSAQAGGMALSDGTPLVSDDKVGEVVDAMEKTASANPARGKLVSAINEYFGLDTSAFEARAAQYLANR